MALRPSLRGPGLVGRMPRRPAHQVGQPDLGGRRAASTRDQDLGHVLRALRRRLQPRGAPGKVLQPVLERTPSGARIHALVRPRQARLHRRVERRSPRPGISAAHGHLPGDPFTGDVVVLVAELGQVLRAGDCVVDRSNLRLDLAPLLVERRELLRVRVLPGARLRPEPLHCSTPSARAERARIGRGRDALERHRRRARSTLAGRGRHPRHLGAIREHHDLRDARTRRHDDEDEGRQGAHGTTTSC